MEESIQFAKKYLEDILSFFGLNTDVYATSSDEEVIELNISSSSMNGFLIGQRGETLRAMQFLVGSALKNQNYDVTRVSIDVADYKKQRSDRIAARAEAWIAKVKETGEPYSVEPMNAADRRTIHKLAVDSGIVSESVGEGRERHIVLKPSDSQEQLVD